MDTLLLSRILTGLTLGFHIIFATIGVGLPLLLLIAEGMGIWRKDPHYTLLAKRWSRGLGIIMSIEVVTGTIAILLLVFLWPNFMRVAGHAISLPLFLYTFAFFFEAFFLAFYLYSWNYLKPFTHWLLTIPMLIGGIFTSVFFTTVNAFMNTPGGVLPLDVLFNAAMPSMVFHVLSSTFLATAFFLAGIMAFLIMRGNSHPYYQKGLKLSMVIGLSFSLLTGLSGAQSDIFMEQLQPGMLSQAPQLLKIFYYFMMGTGIYLIVLSGLFLFPFRYQKWMLRFIMAGGIFSILSVEYGWIFAEVGRQPWVIRGNLFTEASVTIASGVELIFFLFFITYFFLGTICINALIRLFSTFTPEKEMEQQGIS